MRAGWGRVLVTGGAGFVGRHLCELLRFEGAEVVAVGRRAADGPWDEYQIADLATSLPRSLCRDVQVVFHLAALTHAAAAAAGPEDYHRQNVAATRSLLDEAKIAGVRAFVFLSSVKAMGEGDATCRSEQDPARPVSAYGRSKLAAEEMVLDPGATGLHACVLRAPLVYGPGVKGNLRSLIDAVRRRRLPPLPDTGNRRSLIDVRDLARALALVAREPAAAGRAYLVTDGRTYSTAEICNEIRAALDVPEPRWQVPVSLLDGLARLGDGLGRLGLRCPYDSATHNKLLGSACYTSQAIADDLGFRPVHSLASSLPAMVQTMTGDAPVPVAPKRNGS